MDVNEALKLFWKSNKKNVRGGGRGGLGSVLWLGRSGGGVRDGG